MCYALAWPVGVAGQHTLSHGVYIVTGKGILWTLAGLDRHASAVIILNSATVQYSTVQ